MDELLGGRRDRDRDFDRDRRDNCGVDNSLLFFFLLLVIIFCNCDMF